MSKTCLECGKCPLCAKLPVLCLTWSRCLSLYACAKYLRFLSFPCGSTLTSLHSIQQTFIQPLLCAGNCTDSLLLCLCLHIYIIVLIRSKDCVQKKNVNHRHLLFLRGDRNFFFKFLVSVEYSLLLEAEWK